MQVFKKLITVILKIFYKTPFYPYFLVKKIKFWDIQKNIYLKYLKALCLLPVFFIVNLLCWILNGIDADHAYAAGFHVAAKK